MDFRKKLRIRLCTAIVYTIIGAVLTAASFIVKNDSSELLSSFGTMCCVIGIAKIIRHLRLIKNDEAVRTLEIAENDERFVMIVTKARSITFSIFIMLLCVSLIVLCIIGADAEMRVLTYVICAFLIIYWITYAILKRKY